MERETGIEPATNSFEGCDSPTELLPPSFSLAGAPRPARVAPLAGPQCPAPLRDRSVLPSAVFRCPPARHERGPQGQSNGGEGRVRTSVAARAADLQSAAIDRSATSPISRGCP